MFTHVISRGRAARIVVAAAVAAILAVFAVAGPLAAPARALAFNPTNETEFWDAIDEINEAEPAGHVITLSNDIAFAGEVQEVLASDGNVFIDGSGFRVHCAVIGACSVWLQVAMESGVFSVTNLTVEGFGNGLVATDSNVNIDGSTFIRNGVDDDGDIEHGGAAISVNNEEASVEYELYGRSLHGVELRGVDFIENVVRGGSGCVWGGAVSVQGDLIIQASHFENNGVELTTANPEDACYVGGGAVEVWDSKAEIWDTKFTGNFARGPVEEWYQEGGDSSSPNVVAGAVSAYTSTVDIYDVTFANNSTDGAGGAVYGDATEFNVEDVVITGNTAENGGGFLFTSSPATIDDSTFSGNSAEFSGGGVFFLDTAFNVTDTTFSDNEALQGYGGGVEVDYSEGSIESSALYGNLAETGGGADFYQSGVSVRATTFAENTAETGAAVQIEEASAELEHVSIARNTATNASDDEDSPPSQLSLYDAEVDIERSFVVEPLGTATNCAIDSDESELESDGFNAADDTTCDFDEETDLQGPDLDSQLGPLQFNGGRTWTMLPDPESPLVDAIDGEACPNSQDPSQDVDQRTVERAQGDGCDIGAVEIFEPIQGPMTTPGGTVWVRILNATDVDEPAVFAMSELTPAAPAGIAFPYGALGLEIEVWDYGWPADIQMLSPAPTNQLWKLFDGAWVQPPGATSESMEGGTLWTFRLIDGGFGDNDLTENFTIVDPAAMGVGAAFTG